MSIILSPVQDPIPVLKEYLTREILDIIRHEHDAYAARWLRCDLARVCDLKRGRHARFSIEKLIWFVTCLDRRVDMRITYAGLQRTHILKLRQSGCREFSSYPPPPSRSF